MGQEFSLYFLLKSYYTMKYRLTIALLSIHIFAWAQSSYSSLQTRIVDDGNRLLIQLDGHHHGRDIHYKHAFAIAELNGLQVDLLKYRVFASQGIPLPIHEMKSLLAVVGIAFILLVAGISYAIRYYQTRKARLTTA